MSGADNTGCIYGESTFEEAGPLTNDEIKTILPKINTTKDEIPSLKSCGESHVRKRTNDCEYSLYAEVNRLKTSLFLVMLNVFSLALRVHFLIGIPLKKWE